MNSGKEPEWLAATIQYRLNIPCALHSISPTLSALHTSRVAALHPDISVVLLPSHCPKCGTYRFSGDHPSYLPGPSTRKKWKRTRRSHKKALERRCHVCGFSIDGRTPDHSSLPVDLSTAASVPTIPQQTKATDLDSRPNDVSRPTIGTVQTAKCAPAPPLPSRQPYPKLSHTKTSTLKDMLSRNRQREEVVGSQNKRKKVREGLAAFLKEL